MEGEGEQAASVGLDAGEKLGGDAVVGGVEDAPRSAGGADDGGGAGVGYVDDRYAAAAAAGDGVVVEVRRGPGMGFGDMIGGAEIKVFV